jgi:hypothetical protein
MESSGQMNLTFDFGDGRQADIEFGGIDQLWVASGPGFSVTDVWVKNDGELIDLRVRVRRTPTGVDISVDRGDEEKGWWGNESAPRLGISVNVAAGVAAAAASIGMDREFQEILLGQTTI